MLLLRKKDDPMHATHKVLAYDAPPEADTPEGAMPAGAPAVSPANDAVPAPGLDEGAASLLAPRLDIHRSADWKRRAAARVPVMSQTFSKAPMSYPQGSYPAFLREGRGCRVVDVDGNEYIDFVLGLGPVVLGYQYPAVDAAVRAQLERGMSFSMAHPLEVEVAELLAEVIPCAEMSRFFKTGSDATSAAIRCARTFTGREKVAHASYHGWHDWYIVSTTRDAGIPRALKDLVVPFTFNDVDSLRACFAANPGEIAAVILEPLTLDEPAPGFLNELIEVAHQHGAVVVFDEIVTGFRCDVGGAQSKYGAVPDLATFGKAMGNGMPIAALCGRADIMRTCEEAFVSGTFGGETLSLAAAKAAIGELRQHDVPRHLERMGERVKSAFESACARHGVSGRAWGHGSHFVLVVHDATGVQTPPVKSLFLQECVRRGVLFHFGAENMCFSHGPHEIAVVERVLDEALEVVGGALREGSVDQLLDGAPYTEVFRRNK